MRYIKATLFLLAVCLITSAQNNASTQSQSQAQNASALEAQYKTCAKHYIPAEKCTPEIYQQLKDKDNAPLDPNTAAALRAAKQYQPRLKNPDSMQVRTAYVTEKGDVCLEIGGQKRNGRANGFSRGLHQQGTMAGYDRISLPWRRS